MGFIFFSYTVIAIYNDIYFIFEMDLFLTLVIYFKQLYLLFMIGIFNKTQNYQLEIQREY